MLDETGEIVDGLAVDRDDLVARQQAGRGGRPALGQGTDDDGLARQPEAEAQSRSSAPGSVSSRRRSAGTASARLRSAPPLAGHDQRHRARSTSASSMPSTAASRVATEWPPRDGGWCPRAQPRPLRDGAW
jgi:hypothetical protein